MKGEDWNFEKFIPDKDDIEARQNALTKFIEKMLKDCLDFSDVDIFCIGFSSGAAWMREKMKEENDEFIIGEKI